MENRQINTVAIIGLGALGILFGHHLSGKLPKESLRMIADQERIDRYRKQGLYCNGELCDFQYITPEVKTDPADLVIFTVKSQGLDQAIRAVRNQVGEDTVLLSALNGITSEEIIGKAYGMEKLLYCVAQGMDAVKEGNRLIYAHMGMLVFGDTTRGIISTKTQAVASFFERTQVPHQVDTYMNKRLWGKFMLNVGVNQTVAVVEGTYRDIQKDGPAREQVIGAMREVLQLSGKAGIHLTEADLNYWLEVLALLNPDGKPSMRQDLEAGRYSEVELFAGTVLMLGSRYGVATPVNQKLYDTIKQIESNY